MDYKVSDIMTKNPLCYTVPSSISEVIKILIKNNVTGIPIKNNQNKYQERVKNSELRAKELEKIAVDYS